MTPDQLEVSAAIWRKSFSSPCVHMYSYIYISVNTHSVYSLKYFNSYNMFFNHMFSKPPAAPFIKIIFHFKGIVCRNKVFKNKVLSPRQVCLHSTVNTWEKIKSWNKRFKILYRGPIWFKKQKFVGLSLYSALVSPNSSAWVNLIVCQHKKW